MLNEVVRHILSVKGTSFPLGGIVRDAAAAAGCDDFMAATGDVMQALGRLQEMGLLTIPEMTLADRGDEDAGWVVELKDGENSREQLRLLDQASKLAEGCRKKAERRGRPGRPALQQMDQLFGRLFKQHHGDVMPDEKFMKFFRFRFDRFLKDRPADEACLMALLCGALYQKYQDEILKWETGG